MVCHCAFFLSWLVLSAASLDQIPFSCLHNGSIYPLPLHVNPYFLQYKSRKCESNGREKVRRHRQIVAEGARILWLASFEFWTAGTLVRWQAGTFWQDHLSPMFCRLTRV